LTRSQLVLVVVGFTLLGLVAARGARRRTHAPAIDITWVAYVFWPIHAFRFWTRRAFGFRRGSPTLRNEPKTNLFGYLPEPEQAAAHQRERDIRVHYALDCLHNSSTQYVYRENLYVLDLLDRIASPHLATGTGTIGAIDVGSHDFRYATALERWLKVGVCSAEGTGLAGHAARHVELEGIELDGHVLREGFFSRADYAAAYAALTQNPDVRYRIGDFRRYDARDRDVVFFWFPFVLRYALVRWGLPLGAFDPKAMIRQAAGALKPGGLLIVVNHTHEERDRQVELLQECALFEVCGTWPARSNLVDYHADVTERTMTIARRLAEPQR